MNDIASQTIETPERKRLGVFSTLLLLIVIGLAAIVGIQLARQNMTQPTSGPAPNFELTTFAGDTFRLSDLRGQVVVLNFWASWCVPCRDEAPILENLWQRYRDRNVILVGVAYADTERDALEFIAEFDITYPNGPDLGTRISDSYRITGVPETFVIDQNGEIQFFLPAPLTEGQLDDVIVPLLETS